MADRIKILGQVAPSTTADTELYTVPTLYQTTTSSLVICNRTAGQLTYTVSVLASGDTLGADNKEYIYYAKTLAANETFTAVLGLTLNEGDAVWVKSSADGLSYNLFGVETG